ncbi:leucine-rich repeat domain-containing protein [Streptomyces mesophilus]|uniref:leucine-rich repeat domain-containing protein n=1 Tax=Streptomyces mesophilus TaxID=1775132 RepID=UPI0033240AAD
MTADERPKVFENRFPEGVAAPGAPVRVQDPCTCFHQGRENHSGGKVGFHPEVQDTSAPGWLRLLELIDEAVADGREEFRPLPQMRPEERRQLVTLPAEIARLTAVKSLVVYGSNLVRIPPEIGAMSSLEEFVPYTSGRLHWFPYEITRCPRLVRSTVSTRAIYGNFKFRAPFPRLQPPRDSVTGADLARLDPARWGSTAISTCSVCDEPLAGRGLHQAWISLVVATDVLPLLVNACSADCLHRLPSGAGNHLPTAHQGGPVEQPPPR